LVSSFKACNIAPVFLVGFGCYQLSFLASFCLTLTSAHFLLSWLPMMAFFEISKPYWEKMITAFNSLPEEGRRHNVDLIVLDICLHSYH
jgi:hypothetical protein